MCGDVAVSPLHAFAESATVTMSACLVAGSVGVRSGPGAADRVALQGLLSCRAVASVIVTLWSRRRGLRRAVASAMVAV